MSPKLEYTSNKLSYDLSFLKPFFIPSNFKQFKSSIYNKNKI